MALLITNPMIPYQAKRGKGEGERTVDVVSKFGRLDLYKVFQKKVDI